MEQDNKLTLPLDAQIEGILFWKGEPVRVKNFLKFLVRQRRYFVGS